MSPRQAAPPPQIDGLTFVSILGSGGFADVYRYEQLGRMVAVKVLSTGLSHNSQQVFEAEANQMAKLSNHPSIVSVYQAGQSADGRSFLVMEICQPQTIDDRLRAKRFTVARSLQATIQIAGAVEAAHRLGILHRDIKPANMLFTEFGRAALTDFGISVSTQAGEQGLGVGYSPAWAPPEQGVKGSPMGPASDVYSLAASCWAMLVGHSPMIVPGGDNRDAAIVARTRTEPLRQTGRADVPEGLERVLRTAMAKDPAHRFGSALDFGRALQAVQVSLHLPVTPLDGGEVDQSDLDHVEETSTGHVETRLSSFQVIDPQGEPRPDARPGFAAPVPAPVAAPAQPAPGQQPAQPVAQPLAQPVEASARAGQDTTVVGAHPPLEVAAEQVVPAPAPGGSRTRTVVTVGVLAVAALLVGGVVLTKVLGDPSTGTTENRTAPHATTPADPIGATVPHPGPVRARVQGGKVVASWMHPDPLMGDRFLYRVLDPASEMRYRETDRATATVERLPGRTCVEVVLRRIDGTASEPKVGCTP